MNSVERVRAALAGAGHPDTIAEFPAGTRTAADAAAAIGCTVAQIAKSIVFRAGNLPVLVIASGANRIDPAKVAGVVGMPVRRAEAQWIRDETGFAIGGVAPAGHLRPVRVVVDADLFALGPVWAAAGSPSHVFKTSAEALLRLSSGAVAEVKAD